MSSLYTPIIKVPQYEIVGDKPKMSQMLNTDRFDKLMDEIREADVPDDIRRFLIAAASRHFVFNYAKIAAFYPHQTAEVQLLMEQSALIILDVDDAIANGYAKFSRMMSEIRAKDGADD
jgi:hypothetical protein